MSKKGSKMAGLDATLALGRHYLDATLTPEPLPPHPNGQKGSKKAQKGQKWLKMAN